MKRLILLLVVLSLSGCGLAQSHCLAPCLDKAIVQHVQDGIDQKNDSLGLCDLREMNLILEEVRCKVRCQ